MVVADSQMLSGARYRLSGRKPRARPGRPKWSGMNAPHRGDRNWVQDSARSRSGTGFGSVSVHLCVS
jgi:hypothetical protein